MPSRLTDRDRLRESERLRSREEQQYKKRIETLRTALWRYNWDPKVLEDFKEDDRLAKEMEYGGLEEQK